MPYSRYYVHAVWTPTTFIFKFNIFTLITASSMSSSLVMPSETRGKSRRGSTCLSLVNFVLWSRSSPVNSASSAITSVGIGVNIDPVVPEGTPMGTLADVRTC